MKFEGGELVYLYSSSAGHSPASFRDRIVARPGSQQLCVLSIQASFIPLKSSYLLEVSIGIVTF